MRLELTGLSAAARVFVDGEVIGDLWTHPLTLALPPLSAGEKVTLLGQDGEAAITVADWAAWKGSHHHDIWCAIGNRVKRIYSE